MSKAGKVSKTYTITSGDGAAVSISQHAARLSTYVTNFVNSFDNYDGYPALKVDLKEQLLRCINWCEMHKNDTTDDLSNTHAEVFVDFTKDDLDDMINSSESLGIKLLTNRLRFSAQQIINRTLIPPKFRDMLDMNEEPAQHRTVVEASSLSPVDARETEVVGYNSIKLLIALGFSFQHEHSHLKALVIGKSEDDRRIFIRLFDRMNASESYSITIKEKALPRKRSIWKLWENGSSLSCTEILVKDDNQTTILCMDFVIRERRHDKYKRGYKSFDTKADFLKGYHVIEEMCKFCCNGTVAKYQIPQELASVSLMMRENHIDRFEIGSVHSFYIASVMESNKIYVAVDQSKALTALNIAQAISKLNGKGMVTSSEIIIADYFYQRTLKYTYKFNHQYEERR